MTNWQGHIFAQKSITGNIVNSGTLVGKLSVRTIVQYVEADIVVTHDGEGNVIVVTDSLTIKPE